MRIVIVNSYNKINARLRNEIWALSEAGHVVKVLLWDRVQIDERQLTREEEKELNIERIRFRAPTRSSKLVFYIPLFSLKVVKKLFREDYDVIHCCHLSLLPAAIFLAKLKGGKIIYDAFEFYTFSFYENLPKPLQKTSLKKLIEFTENKLVSFADGVVTIDSTNDFLLQRYKKFNANIEVLYNVPTLTEEINIPEAIEVKKEFENARVVIYIGGIDRNKGVEQAIKAIDKVRNEVPNVKLLFIGNFRDNSQENVFAFIKCKNLRKYVEFLSWIPYSKLLHYLTVSEIGLALYQPIPRLYLTRGNSRKLFTYMYAGLPIIAPRFAGVGEIVRKVGCGILVDTTDPQRIADAIIHLLEHPEEARAMGERGRKAVEEKYNWEIEKEKLLKVYRKLEREIDVQASSA